MPATGKVLPSLQAATLTASRRLDRVLVNPYVEILDDIDRWLQRIAADEIVPLLDRYADDKCCLSGIKTFSPLDRLTLVRIVNDRIDWREQTEQLLLVLPQNLPIQIGDRPRWGFDSDTTGKNGD